MDSASGTSTEFGALNPVCTSQVLPTELFQEHVAMEYILTQPVLAPPAFLFVVDLAIVDRHELEVRSTASEPICEP